MKCLVLIVCVAVVAVFGADPPKTVATCCKTGACDAKADGVETCTTGDSGTDKFCLMPTWDIEGNKAGDNTQGYQCSATDCTDATKCLSCNNEVNCNSDALRSSYKCFTYTWSGEDNEDAKKGDAKTCYIVGDAGMDCNHPKRLETMKEGTIVHGGCGKCTDTETCQDVTCSDKTKACNSATALSFVVLPLVAILYNLF